MNLEQGTSDKDNWVVFFGKSPCVIRTEVFSDNIRTLQWHLIAVVRSPLRAI